MLRGAARPLVSKRVSNFSNYRKPVLGIAASTTRSAFSGHSEEELQAAAGGSGEVRDLPVLFGSLNMFGTAFSQLAYPSWLSGLPALDGKAYLN
jgi:hypothetical protein